MPHDTITGITVNTVRVVIPGEPQQQGSKRHIGKGRMIDDNTDLMPWRYAAIAAIRAAVGPGWDPVTAPVELDTEYVFPRPKSHYGTGRNTGTLKAGAPRVKTSTPDRDKLDRAVGDALTQAGFWRDDSLSVAGRSVKVYGAVPQTVVIARWGHLR